MSDFEEDKVKWTHLSKIHFQNIVHDNLYIGTQNGFCLKFCFDTDSVEYMANVTDGRVWCVRTYHSNYFSNYDTFVFLLCEEPSSIVHDSWVHNLKIFKELPESLNKLQCIFELNTVDIKTFRLMTDLNNNWYALILDKMNSFYQLNAFSVLAPHQSMKYIDLAVRSESENPLDVIELDPLISKKARQIIKNDKKLYNRVILDFMQINLSSNLHDLSKQIY